MNAMAALMTQAEMYLLQGDVDRAALIAQEARRLDATSVDPEVMVARLALHLGKLEEAGAILQRVIGTAPKHGLAHMLLGLTYEAKAQRDAALLQFVQATRFAPELMPAWFNQGRLMVMRGRVAEAAVAFDKAAALAPDNLAVLAALAQTLARLGQAQRAAKVYLRCVEQNVANPIFLRELADLLTTANEPELADEVLAAGSTVFPSEGLFDAKRAALAILRRDVDAALRWAREAVRRQPDEVDFLLGLAVVETMRLNLDQARLAAERALRIEPTSWRANHQLGIVFEAVKQREKAISFYRRALELAPLEWRPRNNLAVLLLENGAPSAVSEATELLEAASSSKTATVHLNLALAHLKAGRREQALSVARTAVSLGAGRNVVAERARELAVALAA